ncbi:MAG TPA: protein kinase, partial [Pyrinomonadaceae bacterium]
MPAQDWQKVKALFHEALRQNSGEREAFLDRECAGDGELRSEVESLLQSLNDAQDFLEMPVIGESAERSTVWHLENGAAISHYKILRPIGSGGMGEVYLAEDTRLGREVALKVLPHDVLRDEGRLHRFQREANAVTALNHPNILTIFEFVQDDGIHFFASEFVKGETLRQRLERGQLRIVEALEIAIQVCSALTAAHDAGVIHRDIKPENLMIRDDGYVKVLDFGLAKQMDKAVAGQSDTTLAQRFSLPGMIMGTVAYMSPEQARGTRVDGRSDIFALGIVMYEMLTGRPPFRGATTTDVIAEIIQTDPPVPSLINPNVPSDLDEIVDRAIEKDAARRFQDARELLDRLKRSLKRFEFDFELKRTAVGSSVHRTSTSISGDLLPIELGGQADSYLPDLSPMIGREAELAQLTELIISERKRLVTLTGTGGTGKTRLAQELCGRLADKFRDGFVFVRLGEVYDPALVPAVIAHQLHVQEIVGRPVAQTLADFLREKQMLLVLDNFEQIMDAAPFVAELLNYTRDVSAIVTSRERLRIQAETEFNVPPLPVPEENEPLVPELAAKFDSVRLFALRAQQVNPDFKISNDNIEQISKICTTLDGLPLAIELAAARTRVFSPAMILEKLQARLAFLTGGAVDLPKRQQTMRAAVDWSYDLLNEDEKQLFRRLSVFACRFTAEAAEAILSDRSGSGAGPESTLNSVEFLDRFASLADKSLLVRRQHAAGEMNYGLLEIVREYAETRLEMDDDADAVRRRHAAYYLAIAEEAESHLQTKDTGVWIKRLDAEYENIRLALLWSIENESVTAARIAAAIRHFWLIRGHLTEGLAWAEEILTLSPEMSAETKWKILTLCGNASQFQGDIKKAHTFYDEALTAARQTGNSKMLAQSLRGVGALAYLQYDFVSARDLINEAIRLSRSIDDDFGLAAALARLGDISSVEGDTATARSLTAESLGIFRRIGYSEGISAKLYNLGAIVFLDGDHQLARQHFEEAHITAMELGEKINTRLIFDGFAALAAETGDFVRAAKLSGAAESLGATIGYTIEPAEQIFRDAYQGKLK